MIKALKIRVRDTEDDGEKVNVTIPLKALELLDKLTPRRIREELTEEGINLSEIVEASKSIDEPGTLVEIETEEKQIKITLE